MEPSIINKPYFNVTEFKNKCFTKDLIISFSMSDNQKQYVLDSIERYNQSKVDEYGLNSFEQFQYHINSSAFSNKQRYSFLLDSVSLYLSPNNSKFKINKLDFNHLIQLVKRDKSGVLFKAFKEQFINNYSFLQLMESTSLKFSYYGNQPNAQFQNKIYGKLNDDSTLDMKCLQYNSVWNKVELNISEANITNCTSKSTIRSFHYPYLKLFNATKEELESRTPSLNQWGLLNQDEVYNSFVIPSLKDICISVLKEMYLINRNEVVNQIKKLPNIILLDFINNCFEDEKPVAQEILLELFKEYMLSSNGIDYSQVDELLPLERFIKSGIKREEWFRYNYCNGIIQDLFYPHYRDSFAINVYENQYLFKKRTVPLELENQILFKSKLNETGSNSSDSGPNSIVDKSTFINSFNTVTNGLFKDLSNLPSGIIFVGGIITYCLTQQIIGGDNIDQLEQAYSKSDIDICCYGPTASETIMQFIDNYFRVYCEPNDQDAIYDDITNQYYKLECSATKLNNHITISKHFPLRHVQINIYPYRSIEEVLMGVDIDASCFAFNGENVFCLERGMHSMNYRMNIASNHSYIVREDNQYQRRLIKFLDRGFNIFYISSKAIQDIVNDVKFVPSKSKVGFSLLYSAKLSNTVYQELIEDSDIDYGQPYGPEWDKNKYEQFVISTSDQLYDGYGSEKSFRYLVDSIASELWDYDADRYNFTNSYWDTDLTNEEIIYNNRDSIYSSDSIAQSTIKSSYYSTLNNIK